MSAIPPKVTIVSEDKDLLREVSWCLTAYGYQTQTSRLFAPLIATWKWSPSDFLIVDSSHSNFGSISQLPHLGNERFTYKILLWDMNESLDSIAEMEYSFNDAVSKPLNLGELLARLRAGTKFLKFESSVRAAILCDPCTGLLSRSGLIQTLNLSRRGSAKNAPGNIGLVLLSVDFLADITTRYGTEVRDQILCDVADIIESAAGEQAWIGRIGANAFAMAFLNGAMDQAEQLAQQIRQQVASKEFRFRGAKLQLTATLCVNALDGPTFEPTKALAEAEKNLRYAQTLGGSTVSRCGQFDESYADWVEQHINSGAVGSQLTAQDIMTPFTAELREGHIQEPYLAALRDSEVAVTPYFDRQGEYRGIVRARDWEETLPQDFQSAVEAPAGVSTLTSRDELIDQFTDGRQELLVVMCDTQPVGYITSQDMAEILAPV